MAATEMRNACFRLRHVFEVFDESLVMSSFPK